MAEDDRLVFVGFDQDARPWCAYTQHSAHGVLTRYQFEYCRRDRESYYHWSATGGTDVKEFGWEGCTVWYVDGLTVSLDHPCPRLSELPCGARDEFFDSFIHGATLYCERCEDWLPEDRPCVHLGFCEDCGDWFYTDYACPRHTRADGSARPSRFRRTPAWAA